MTELIDIMVSRFEWHLWISGIGIAAVLAAGWWDA